MKTYFVRKRSWDRLEWDSPTYYNEDDVKTFFNEALIKLIRLEKSYSSFDNFLYGKWEKETDYEASNKRFALKICTTELNESFNKEDLDCVS